MNGNDKMLHLPGFSAAIWALQRGCSICQETIPIPSLGIEIEQQAMKECIRVESMLHSCLYGPLHSLTRIGPLLTMASNILFSYQVISNCRQL